MLFQHHFCFHLVEAACFHLVEATCFYLVEGFSPFPTTDLFFVEMKAVSFLEHCVNVVGHSVLSLLHEFELTDIRLEQSGEVSVG
jgi:hypothetical protein